MSPSHVPAPPAPRLRVQTALIVDDEDDILQSLDTLLVSSIPNTRCLQAASAADALDILRREKVDVIISDFKMPGMDGVRFLEQAKAIAPHVPRVLLTAFPDLDVAMDAINAAGVETFLTKPLDPKRVIQVVASAMARRRAREDREKAMGRALAVKRANGGA